MCLPLTRRGVLATGTGIAALPALAACGDETAPVESAPAAPRTGTALVDVADVPVGGCAVVQDHKVVVTQPSEGEFKAFSAVCTHQGCLVSSSSDGVIPCTCHGSDFSLTDGSVIKGPAKEPLAEVSVEARDGVVTTTDS